MIKDEQNVTSIENPASAGIITGQWLYGDESSEESNESPERNSKEDKD